MTPFDGGDVELIAAQIANREVARLLLAAPDLLAACKAAASFVENDRFTSGNDASCDCNSCRTIRELRAAIKLAEEGA